MGIKCIWALKKSALYTSLAEKYDKLTYEFVQAIPILGSFRQI